MKFSILEETVIISALTHYSTHCEECLNVPENKDNVSFVKGDIDISKLLIEKA